MGGDASCFGDKLRKKTKQYSNNQEINRPLKKSLNAKYVASFVGKTLSDI